MSKYLKINDNMIIREEDKMISEQCLRFVRLHAVDGARPYVLKDLNVPYETPADIEVQFPPENIIVDIPN